jgi:hypothetical protein
MHIKIAAEWRHFTNVERIGVRDFTFYELADYVDHGKYALSGKKFI